MEKKLPQIADSQASCSGCCIVYFTNTKPMAISAMLLRDLRYRASHNPQLRNIPANDTLEQHLPHIHRVSMSQSRTSITCFSTTSSGPRHRACSSALAKPRRSPTLAGVFCLGQSAKFFPLRHKSGSRVHCPRVRNHVTPCPPPQLTLRSPSPSPRSPRRLRRDSATMCELWKH